LHVDILDHRDEDYEANHNRNDHKDVHD
jgi:hypothetical protein